MKALFEQLGFVAASTHPTKAVTRYKQGRINLLVNDEPTGQVAEFRAAHGPSANGMAFTVENIEQAYAEALKRGAVAADAGKTVLGASAQVLEGIGGSMLYLVEGPRRGVLDLERRARRRRGGSGQQCGPRPAGSPDPQRQARPDAHLVDLLSATSSASRSRSTSTSRARPRACSAKR